ncbi:MAG TPA: hypothetical protein VF331_21060 [Polyangiales bacterium]
MSVALARPKQIRVDGELGEWRGLRFSSLGDAADGSAQLCLAYDATGLYVAARVHDDHFVRSAHPGPGEDALVLTLALPEAGRWTQRELWLYAGVPGRQRASVAMRVAAAGSQESLARLAEIVEGPLPDGYTLEAFIPWSALGRGAHWAFARGALRLHDVDVPAGSARDRSTAIANSPAELPWLLFDGGPVQALAGLLREKNLGGAVPRLDWVGELRGDGKAVRVLVLGTFVVLSDEGSTFTFEDLPITSSADVLEPRLQDLTGDGRPELMLRLRQRNELGARELWRVLDLQAAHARPLFGIETRKQTADGFVGASVEVRSAAGRAAAIVVRAGEAHGLSADNYREDPAAGVEPILLPWGPVREREYGWDGTRFAVTHELPSTHAVAPARAQPAAPAAARAPAPPAQTVDAASVLEAYRQARGLPASAQPSYSLQANLADDARLETVMTFGNELVIVGEGFRGGSGFFYFTLPVRDGADVLHLFAGDVTGDGRSELFVRVRQHIGEVEREILLGYSFAADALQPVLRVEVRRARGQDSVANVVSLVREGQRSVLEIKPGTASGWAADSYPFSSESLDGIGPLLLPWRDAVARYRYVGQQLVSTERQP